MILTPATLDYWRTFDPTRGIETPDIFDLIEPHMGRLTVFDPRFPHGVRLVEGEREPARGRVVLHGWFTEPTPFFTGGCRAGGWVCLGLGAGAGWVSIWLAGSCREAAGALASSLHVAASSRLERTPAARRVAQARWARR